MTPNSDDTINEIETVKDLGILIDSDLKFTSHVNSVTMKAKQKIGWVFRNFLSRDHTILKTIWRSIIQPHIDYCSPLWFDPNNLSQLRAIENLQRTYTRRFSGLGDLNYWERLQTLKMFSQERRLERYRIIYTWKTLEGLIPNCGRSSHYSTRRGRNAAIKPLITNSTARIKSIREGSFLVNGPRLFNSLQATLRNMSNCSVDSFKQQLDLYISCLPDEPSCDNLTPGASSQVTGRQSNSIIDQARRYHRT